MKYPELKWVVLCQWPGKPYWEPIAAFNEYKAAITYMEACEDVNSGLPILYKIEEITNG
jgi:hypothetical protein